eukprot:Awhi_evm1s3239
MIFPLKLAFFRILFLCLTFCSQTFAEKFEIHVPIVYPESGVSSLTPGVLLSAFKQWKSYLSPRLHDLVNISSTANVYPDDPGIAVRKVQEVIVSNSSSFSIDGFYSSVTKFIGPVYASYGMPIITSSADYVLQDKEVYPTTFGITITNYNVGGSVASFIYTIGWSRMALIYVDNDHSKGMETGFLEKAGIYNFTVFSRKLPEFIDTDEKRDVARAILQELKELQIFVFVTVTTVDAANILNLAYELQMFGHPNYNWIDRADILNSAAKSRMPSIPESKFGQAMTGVMVTGPGCDSSTVEKHKLNDNYPEFSDNPYACHYHDQSAATLYAMNTTLNYMVDNNMPIQCLEHEYYSSPNTTCRSFYQKTLNYIKSQTMCPENSLEPCLRHCGVCALLKKYQDGGNLAGDINVAYELNIFQALQTLSLSSVDFEGASGRVVMGKDGFRDANFQPRAIFNFQGKAIPEIVGYTKFDSPDFKDFKLDITTQLLFSDGSTIVPSDQPADNEIEKPLWYRITIGSILSLGMMVSFLFACALFAHRKVLILRTSSPSLMGLMLLGAFFMYSSVFIISVPALLNETLCILHTWLYYVGFVSTFFILLLKTYRLALIFSKKNASEKSIQLVDTKFLYLYFSLGLMVMVIILSIWTVTAETIIQEKRTRYPFGDDVEFSCSVTWWNILLLVIEIIFGMIALILAYTVRQLPNYFNEGKLICVIVYNWCIIMGLSKTIIFLIDGLSSLTQIAILSIAVFINITVMLVTFFGHRFLKVYQGNGNDRTKTSAMESASKNTPRMNQSSDAIIEEGKPTKQDLDKNTIELETSVSHHSN